MKHHRAYAGGKHDQQACGSAQLALVFRGIAVTLRMIRYSVVLHSHILLFCAAEEVSKYVLSGDTFGSNVGHWIVDWCRRRFLCS